VCDLRSAEVLLVDDGSSDGSDEVFQREAKGLPFRIARHRVNQGITAAVTTGFAEALGEEIVTLDCDGTYDPIQAKELLVQLRKGSDVVTGSPYHPQGSVVGVPSWRLLLSKGLSRLYATVLPAPRLYTYTSCFRAYRKSSLGLLNAREPGFAGIAELMATAIIRGAKVGEVPATLRTRQQGVSKLKVARTIVSHCVLLTRLLLRTHLASGRLASAVLRGSDSLPL
jgi:dolichol-phosphate mannosyltransferase